MNLSALALVSDSSNHLLKPDLVAALPLTSTCPAVRASTFIFHGRNGKVRYMYRLSPIDLSLTLPKVGHSHSSTITTLMP